MHGQVTQSEPKGGEEGAAKQRDPIGGCGATFFYSRDVASRPCSQANTQIRSIIVACNSYEVVYEDDETRNPAFDGTRQVGFRRARHHVWYQYQANNGGFEPVV